MTAKTKRQPKSYRGIMVSSTFTDLEEHRQKVIEAIQKSGHKANVMEHSVPQAEHDVIVSSIEMVRDSAAYIGLISRKYGQTPFDPKLNPKRLSITELEFNEAMKLGRPILLFIMGAKHPVIEADIELDAGKRKKLDVFRKRAKRMRKGSEAERVYAEFESLNQFSSDAANAVGRLAQLLASDGGDTASQKNDATEQDSTLPRPPELAALPRYLGSHEFVGRASELRTLSDWCGPADPNPMLLFEAIGGSGKSMLTWEWLTKYATNARADWAGRFWYSFYEKGAVMADFCRQALAYTTERPSADFLKLRTPQLADLLVAELEKRPWLMVLDGLERVLVAYHRHDAAQIRDEEVDTASDQIGRRDPRIAIRPEDDGLLRRLAAVPPSKILITSRLTPLALINRSGMPVPGVRREMLSGLRPADAEAMIRTCGVTGDSNAIQGYLQTNCDCHPLVIGALAGLINSYPPDRGNFDRWANDQHYGSVLNLAKLDLTQRRNHLLDTAVGALSPESRQLLQTLALLQAGVDFDTLTFFNPHLPPESDEVDESHDPTTPLGRSYLKAHRASKDDPAVAAAPSQLIETVRDLEKRGLLQYDTHGKQYDLHPVVRGVVTGQMGGDITNKLGQKVVDHFGSRSHDTWDEAKTLSDVAPGLQVMHVLLRMKRYDQAALVYMGSLANALDFNLEAKVEMQALLKPFFPDGWSSAPVPFESTLTRYILNSAAIALRWADPGQARGLYEKFIGRLRNSTESASLINVAILNLAELSEDANRRAERFRLLSLALDVSEASRIGYWLFCTKLELFRFWTEAGCNEIADGLWSEIDHMGRFWPRENYRPGDAELSRAVNLFYRGKLNEDILREAERLSGDGRNRTAVRLLHVLRGDWYMASEKAGSAIDSFAQAARMAREVGREDSYAEAMFVLARLRAGESVEAHAEAERLSRSSGRAALAVAELRHALGENKRAIESALQTHQWAVADGEPHVNRYYLNRSRELLTQLGAELPPIPRYDPSKAAPFPWEDDVRKIIEELRPKKAEKYQSKRRKKKT